MENSVKNKIFHTQDLCLRTNLICAKGSAGMENSMEKILVTRSSMPPMEEYIEEIASIWDNHWLTNMGEKHVRLEKELKEYLGVDDITLFSNGHMALELTLQAMHLKGEVITTPYTFASTTHAIVRNGLKVIYDAAHAFGETYNGRGAGSFGDASMFSFHATKVYNTIEGGAVCYSDEELGRRLYRLKNFGIMDEETVDYVGANAKMNEFQAAMGLCNLKHVDGEIARRKAVVDRYRANLDGVRGVQLSKVQDGVKYNYAYFPVVFNEEEFGVTRDVVFEKLAENDIFARKYFYPITNTFECYNGMFDPNDTPVALKISKRVLTLPLFADLPLSDVDRICDIIKDCAE